MSDLPWSWEEEDALDVPEPMRVWFLPEHVLLTLLYRAASGEDPFMLMLELVANADETTIEPD